MLNGITAANANRLRGEARAIGVDVGGSHVVVGLVDRDGHVGKVYETKLDRAAKPDATLQFIADSVNKIKKTYKNVCGVGIGIPGLLDEKRSEMQCAINLPEWHNVQVTSILSGKTGLPVFMENDVRVAALAEHRFGAGKGLGDMVMIAVGTGVGIGVIKNGALVEGPKGTVADDMTGHRCVCGKDYCSEHHVSAPEIAWEGRKLVESNEPTSLRALPPDAITAKNVSDAANGGDVAALGIITKAGDGIGLGVASIAKQFPARRFVIGGGVAEAGKPLLDAARAAAARELHSPPEIVPAALGPRAGLIGAATLAYLRAGIFADGQTP